MVLFKYLKHRLLILFWHLRKPKSNWDFISRALTSVAVRWEGETDPIITYLAMFEALRKNKFKGTLIEFGGGFSTILAPTFLKIPSDSITSVDFNPQKYHRILSSRTATKSFLNRIDFQSQITVSLAEVNTCLQEITEALEQTDSKPINTALSTFGYNNKFNRERLINDFQSHPSYMEEVHFYNQHAATSGQKFCSNLAASQTRYNAYFFDCGEISSVAEFWICKENDGR